MRERRKEKEEERKQDETCAPVEEGAAEGEGRLPHLGKPLHQQGDQLGQKGSFRGSQRRAQQPVSGRQDRVRPTQMVHAQPCMLQPETCDQCCRWGWEQEFGVWRANPGRGLLLAARRQPVGMGMKKSATGNARGGNLDRHRNKAPLLSDVQGVRLPLQLLSPRAGPCLPGH